MRPGPVASRVRAALLRGVPFGDGCQKVTEIHKDRYVREVVREYDITPNQAAAIFDFQLNGCLAVNRAAYRRSTFCVEDNRDTIGEFIRSGLSNFGTRDGQKG